MKFWITSICFQGNRQKYFQRRKSKIHCDDANNACIFNFKLQTVIFPNFWCSLLLLLQYLPIFVQIVTSTLTVQFPCEDTCRFIETFFAVSLLHLLLVSEVSCWSKRIEIDWCLRDRHWQRESSKFSGCGSTSKRLSHSTSQYLQTITVNTSFNPSTQWWTSLKIFKELNSINTLCYATFTHS